MGYILKRAPIVGFDEAEVRRAVAVLADPENAIAFRGLKSGREACAPGNDLDACVRAARSLADDRNLYYLLNPVAIGHTGNTNTAHILRRRWLLIDVDPVKAPGHKDDMATDGEKAGTQEVAHAVYLDLRERGWPDPVEIDSGNGCHLLYRIDLPNDDGTRALIQATLLALHQRHSGPNGKVDTAPHDAPRISKLPGSTARKGDNTPQRPYRPCRLLSVPDVIGVVDRSQLESLASLAKTEPKKQKPRKSSAYAPPPGTPPYATKALSEELSRIASEPENNRNNTLNDGAFRLFTMAANPTFGLSPDQVEAECIAAGMMAGLPEDECRSTVASARKAGEANPRADLLPKATAAQKIAAAAKEDVAPRPPKSVRPLPPRAEPFPLEALPRSVRDLAIAAADVMGCDPTFIILPSLAACASAIGNTRHLRIKPTWYEPPILWTVVVGESGTMKTPAFRLALDPLWKAQKRWRKGHAAAERQYEADAERHKERCRSARDKGETSPDPPLKPVQRRASVQDVTVEKLADMLEEQPRGLLVARDELSGWLGSFTRYRSNGTDLPNWLELYQAGRITVDRKTGDRRSIAVDHASVCVTGGIQPDVLAKGLTEDFFSSGLVARLLLTWPETRRKEWSEREVDQAVIDRYASMTDALLDYRMRPTDDGLMPHAIPLEGDARDAWVEWYTEWAGVQDAAEGQMAAMYSKIEAVAARLALVHHCCTLTALDCDSLRPLALASMEAGVTMAKWFAESARRVYFVARATDDERQASALSSWINRQGGTATARDLHKANPGRYPDAESARLALDAYLVQNGFARWEDRPPGPKGGRPTELCRLLGVSSTHEVENPKQDETEGEPS